MPRYAAACPWYGVHTGNAGDGERRITKKGGATMKLQGALERSNKTRLGLDWHHIDPQDRPGYED